MTALSEIGDFTAFYQAKWHDAVRWARALADPAVAEDVAQDAFVSVRRNWDRVQEPTSYLRTAVVNTARSWHRSRARAELREQRIAESAAVFSPEIDETLAQLDALPERQRTVLVLRYYLDLDDKAIAETLECREGTVRSLASRGIAQLRKEMSQ